MGECDLGRELTAEEARAVASLKRLAKRWPSSLKLFSAAGSLIVVPSGWGPMSGATSRELEEAVIASIDGITNDGGDPW